MRSVAAILLATCLIAPGQAEAQGSPSSGLIIKRLTPGDRGISRADPAATPQAPSTPSAAVGNSRSAMPLARATSPPAVARPASIDLTIQFASNSSQLLPGALQTLNELGRALASPALASYRFRIEGHTDTTGTQDRNKQLSEERAARVVDHLATVFHIDRARMEPAGLGQEQLLVQTAPNTPQARNRRVTVVNIGS